MICITQYKMLRFFLFLVFLSGIIFLVVPAGTEALSSPTGSMLDIGITVNEKMKSLAAGVEVDPWTATDNIKAIHMSDSLPDGFTPSESNTVSTFDSKHPIYIYFENNEDAGIMYFFTEDEKIVMNPDSSFMFGCNTALADISGLADWDSSKVTDMYGLFGDAKSLPDALALKNWDTSNVTDMSYMFCGATSMLSIDVSNWKTQNVTTMASMFEVGDDWKGNGLLSEILGLDNLNVSNVTDMTCMFYGAGQMTYYDISGWDVSRVESMNHMFCDNFNLRLLDLSSWDVSSVRTIYCMFDDNHSLVTIGDVSHWNTINLIDAGGWLNDAISFLGDSSGTLDLSGWNTSNLKSAGEMFLTTKIRKLDISGWSFESITNESWEGANTGIYYAYGNKDKESCGLGGMFMEAEKLTTVYISQAGVDSYNTAIEKGINTLNMWFNTKVTGFTVK